ncbi:SDR family NAD(P)-dependent oxidoreductase [Corynebacterium comes]|uniref:1-deoxy-11-beta-hydroxypentalenate dehydrogenase n=1 Tax=Corynebacterium comes TaxID=2675218 RepID=A0A6B8W320_9CORY|nr:SDR family NAD(P)-dependent oxidoreductase [Corynebacterium comes]QGU04150.1 1-deoxy-11-beta-hydroxypentalenate dehydrogenase [Corynebacterium comes]
MGTFTNRTAVVTGGASGIGFGLTIAFLEAGANVAIADIEDAALDRALMDLEGRGFGPNRVIGVRTDVRHVEDVQALADRTVEAFGAVHYLCNNAGVETGGSFGKIPESAWRWVMDVNYFGALNGCRVFLPLLEQHPETHIVNTASVAAFASGAPMMIPYCASKMAILGLTESLEAELRTNDSNVHLSVLAPGPVRTNMTNAERNRPADVPEVHEEARKVAIAQLAKVTQEVGMEPSQVAEQVLQSIEDKRFFILTHPEIALKGIRDRLNWMETGEAPPRRVAGK